MDSIHQIINKAPRDFIRSALTLEPDLDRSFSDFHCKGVNYVCLHRSEELTLKLYEMPVHNTRYIVSPHNHIYNFDTVLLYGDVINYYFEQGNGQEYFLRKFSSKLNHGGGFSTIATQCRLRVNERILLANKLDQYYCTKDKIHTLKVYQPSLIFIAQYKDIDTTSIVYTDSYEKPSLEGLYNKLSPEKAKQILQTAKDCLA